jgi:beta-mannosidase
MSRQFRIIPFIIALFAIIDGWAWRMTYQIHTAPSPEELQQQKVEPATQKPSQVKPIGDNFHQTISLNGEWRYKQTGSGIGDYPSITLDTTDWHNMDLPQNWYLTGLNYHGVIWFRKDFQADPAWQGRLVQLKFEGVDYFADVWLNGVKIGHHEGYFQPFKFDITNHINYEGGNILAIRVESPFEEYKTNWPFRKTLIKGIFNHSTSRPGDAWGPTGQEFNTGGIWNDVSLEISDFITINDVQISATWPSTLTLGLNPTVNVSIGLENHADTTIDAEISLNFIPKNHSGNSIILPVTSVTLPRGEKTASLSSTVQDPVLWWPWDRGDPNLYTAHLEIKSGGVTLADSEISFGFRQIKVTDDWQWYFNGKRFTPRGGNYVSSQWLSEADQEWFLRDVQLIKDANLNFIRVPGHIEPDEFYQATDEAGILVWQDFPLQWGYTDAPAFIDEAQKQLEDMVRLFYNHPSIVVWCTHNEGPTDMGWLADVDDNYSPSQNRRLDTILYNRATQLDPTRHVHKNAGSGDNHVYIGWNSGQWLNYGDWSPGGSPGGDTDASSANHEFSLPGAPFVTEYGAQALPNLEMMSTIFLPEELTFTSGEIRDRWNFHNFQQINTFNTAQIDQGESIEDFIQASQAYQANLIQFATENYRRAKYNPMQGIFYGLITDSWPSIGFSVLDYDRQPKMGYYALQTAMQPILPSIQAGKPSGLEGRAWVYEDKNDFWASLWVINDTTVPYPEAMLNWWIETGTGQRVTYGQIEVQVEADSSKPFWTISSNRVTEGNYDIYVTLSTHDGQLLGENSFSLTILPQPQGEIDGG